MDETTFTNNDDRRLHKEDNVFHSDSPEIGTILPSTQAIKILKGQATGKNRVKQALTKALSSIKSDWELHQLYSAAKIIMHIDYPNQNPLLIAECLYFTRFARNFSPSTVFIWGLQEHFSFPTNPHLIVKIEVFNQNHTNKEQ